MLLLLVTMHTFVLDLQALVADLKPIHLFNGGFSRYDRVIRDKTKALGFPGISIHVYLGADNVSKRIKGSSKISICQIMRQVVDE